jgi:hypothetical protein
MEWKIRLRSKVQGLRSTCPARRLHGCCPIFRHAKEERACKTKRDELCCSCYFFLSSLAALAAAAKKKRANTHRDNRPSTATGNRTQWHERRTSAKFVNLLPCTTLRKSAFRDTVPRVSKVYKSTHLRRRDGKRQQRTDYEGEREKNNEK